MIRTVWNKLKQLNHLMNRHSDMLYQIEIIMRRLHALAYIDAEQYRRALFSDAKYRDGNRLEPYGFKVYSQCDEDGIIQEIFNRIGLKSSTFIVTAHP
jgi:hypothetical protein